MCTVLVIICSNLALLGVGVGFYFWDVDGLDSVSSKGGVEIFVFLSSNLYLVSGINEDGVSLY